jgi:hypothetical protein
VSIPRSQISYINGKILLMKKIQIVQTDELPQCPYCDRELDVIEKTTKGFIEKNIVYRCPYCKKLLSIGNIGLY